MVYFQFAIITSPVKAESLHRHCTGGRTGSLSSAAKLAILRQTANGLSYLHAKGILNHIDAACS